MRLWPTLVALLAVAVTGAADDRRRDRPETHVIVPVDPNEHERVHFFRRHRGIPCSVTINRAPYVCDADRREFPDREAFFAHLQTEHPGGPESTGLVVRDGQVHYVGPRPPPP
jgi:hypothetical protein